MYVIFVKQLSNCYQRDYHLRMTTDQHCFVNVNENENKNDW